MKSRAKDRKPVPTQTVRAPSSQNESINIRKIENGFIVRHCSSGKNGEYKEREIFTPKKPDIGLKSMKRKGK